MSKRRTAQRYRQWAEIPPSRPVLVDEIEVQAKTPEQAKAQVEEGCRKVFAGQSVKWRVDIVDGQVQVFLDSGK